MMKKEEMEKKEWNTTKAHQAQGLGREPKLHAVENRQAPAQDQRGAEKKEDDSDGIDRRSRLEIPVCGCHVYWQG